MSSILDALRKTHPRKSDTTGVGDPVANETAGTEVEIEEIEERDERVGLVTPETSPPRVAPTPPAAPVSNTEVVASEVAPAVLADVVPESPWPDPPAVTPSRQLPTQIELPPPLGEFPPDDTPRLLASFDEAASRRKKLVRAGVVVAIGVVLGLWAGNRFLREMAPESDELLTAAALDAKVAAPKEPLATEPSSETASARSAARAEKKAGKSAKGEPETGSQPGEKSATSPAEVETAANPTPSAAPPAGPNPVPNPAVAPSPAGVAAPAPASPSAGIVSSPPPAPGASATAAVKAEPPRPAPPAPAAIQPPAAAPAVLGPLPDDAPQLALLFIQWSAEPERRVASLRQSGGAISIVHEGDVIQGLKVGVIRPAAIEMQWRGMSYNLPASRH